MGQIRKINGFYYIEFHARGLLYSQLAGKNLEEAQKLLLQVEEKIAGGEALTITRHIDLPDFFERFIAEARGQYYSPKTVTRFAGTIKHFSSFIDANFPQVRQLAQLTPAVIESYKVYLAKTQKVKIVNLTILLIKDVLEFGIKLGFLNDNPSLHVRLLPWPTKYVIPAPSTKGRSSEGRAGPHTGHSQELGIQKWDHPVTARYNKAKRLLSQGVGLAKFAQLLKLPDVSRAVYYANLIPLSREDMHQ